VAAAEPGRRRPRTGCWPPGVRWAGAPGAGRASDGKPPPRPAPAERPPRRPEQRSAPVPGHAPGWAPECSRRPAEPAPGPARRPPWSPPWRAWRPAAGQPGMLRAAGGRPVPLRWTTRS
jgi:hypothetical protein